MFVSEGPLALDVSTDTEVAFRPRRSREIRDRPDVPAVPHWPGWQEMHRSTPWRTAEYGVLSDRSCDVERLSVTAITGVGRATCEDTVLPAPSSGTF